MIAVRAGQRKTAMKSERQAMLLALLAAVRKVRLLLRESANVNENHPLDGQQLRIAARGDRARPTQRHEGMN